MTYKYVDLFAGCGGLSLGLESTGGELIVAVERSPMAAETFYHNFISRIDSSDVWKAYTTASLAIQAKSGLIVTELQNVLSDETTMELLTSSAPDVVVGGPPCQGFSLAGRRNPDDVRNVLPWQFLEMVEKTRPKMVIIENVVGMRHKFNKNDGLSSVFDQLQTALAETSPGYEVQAVQVNAVHYGAPQHRPRLMIIGLRKDLASEFGIASSGKLWKSDFLDKLDGPTPALAPIPTLMTNEARTVGQAIGNLSPTNGRGDRNAKLIKELESNWGFLDRMTSKTVPNHVPRKHSPQSIQRFRLYQWMSNNQIDTRLLAKVASLPTPDQKDFARSALGSAHFPASAPDGTFLASNADEMCDLIVKLQTKKHSQRVLDWNQPSRTVVTIGDDYVHPVEPRTFTVRELARFQGFPNDFEFRAKETTGGVNRRNEVPQYSQVGNAVSPYLAKAVGEMINMIIGGNRSATATGD
jgi:DNA (cytosine-5)-methyltransferase 1